MTGPLRDTSRPLVSGRRRLLSPAPGWLPVSSDWLPVGSRLPNNAAVVCLLVTPLPALTIFVLDSCRSASLLTESAGAPSAAGGRRAEPIFLLADAPAIVCRSDSAALGSAGR